MSHPDSDDQVGTPDDLPDPPDFKELIELEKELRETEATSRRWIEQFDSDEGLFDEPERILARFGQLRGSDQEEFKEVLEEEKPTAFAILFGDPIFIVERVLSLPKDKADKLMAELAGITDRQKAHEDAKALLADPLHVLTPLAQMSAGDLKKKLEKERPTLFAILLGGPDSVLARLSKPECPVEKIMAELAKARPQVHDNVVKALETKHPAIFATWLAKPVQVVDYALLLNEFKCDEFQSRLHNARPQTFEAVGALFRDPNVVLGRIEQMPKGDQQQIKERLAQEDPTRFQVLFGNPESIIAYMSEAPYRADEIMNSLEKARPRVHQVVKRLRELASEGAEPEPDASQEPPYRSCDETSRAAVCDEAPMELRATQYEVAVAQPELYERVAEEPRVRRPQIFGNNSVCCRFLSRGAELRRSVGRIINGKTSIGTAFLIAPNLLMTNRHVFERRRENDVKHEHVAKLRVEFDHLPKMQSQIHELLPYEFLHYSHRYPKNTKDELDYAIVYVASKSNRGVSLAHREPIRLLKDSGAVNTERVNIVQHPGQHEQVIVLRDNEVRGPLHKMLVYSADTSWGSSGSPVFNDQWILAAMHRRTVPFVRRNKYSGKPEVQLKMGKDNWVAYPRGEKYRELSPRFKLRQNAGIRVNEIYTELENLFNRTGKEQTWSEKEQRLIAACLQKPIRSKPTPPVPGKGKARNDPFRTGPNMGNGQSGSQPSESDARTKAFGRDVAAWNRLSKARDR